MFIARDEDGLLSIFINKPHRYQDIVWEWKSMEYYPLTYTEKIIRDDGSYFYKLNKIIVPEEIDKITWNDEPIEVELVKDENGLMYLCRDNDYSFQLFAVMPKRNSMHSWWSGPSKITLVSNSFIQLANEPDENLKEFENLKWEDEPIKVNFKIKNNNI